MTNEEAKRKIENQKLQFLEECIDYSGISEAYDMAIQALEKQIPQKAITNEVFALAVDYDCPRCRARIIIKVDGKWTAGNKSRYCHACGQALDWGDK